MAAIDPHPDILPGVHRMGTALVNWYLVEDGGRVTAIDAGLPGYRRRLDADLAAFGHTLRDIEALVLTHADSDHTGLAAVMQESGARVLIHGADEPALRDGRRKQTDGSPLDLLANLWRPQPYRFLAHIITAGGARPTTVQGAEQFADGDVLDVPGRPRVIATPGHTPGHCALYFERHRALFVGDALCSLNPLDACREPQAMPALLNVSTPQCHQSLTRLETVDAHGVFFGHGEPWRDGVPAALASARVHARAAR